MSAPPVEFERVSHWYEVGGSRRRVLREVSARIERGAVIVVSGPSGSGKTTLLTLIGGLRSTQEGSMRVLGTELRGASEELLRATRRSIGYIFQRHNLMEALTATQNVELALTLRDGTRREQRAIATEMLERLGLGEVLHQRPDHLSGGQRQRVAIGRALACEPSIILADEPTASLDSRSSLEVVQLLRDIAHKRGTAVLIVTHDAQLFGMADWMLRLHDGMASRHDPNA